MRRLAVEPHHSGLVIGYFRNVHRWYVGERADIFYSKKWKMRVLFSDYSKSRCMYEAKRIWKTDPVRYKFQ